ncbi:hypothetical protein A3710_05085 [Stutzerimonas frequens]|nr:hypothetical protein A3710_05085 [Stutzerimonas frequens]
MSKKSGAIQFVVLLHPSQMLLGRDVWPWMIFMELAHHFFEHSHMFFHMHLALADWRFLCLNQNRFSFIAQLLKALESAVASSFSPSYGRQHHRSDKVKRYQQFHKGDLRIKDSAAATEPVSMG